MKFKIVCIVLSLLTAMAPLVVLTEAAGREEIELLAYAIEAIAPGGSYTVQVSLGAVLINRLKDSSYPSSLAAVISDAGIDISSVTPSSQALRAASDAIGGFDPTSGALRYSNEPISDAPVLLGTDGWNFY